MWLLYVAFESQQQKKNALRNGCSRLNGLRAHRLGNLQMIRGDRTARIPVHSAIHAHTFAETLNSDALIRRGDVERMRCAIWQRQEELYAAALRAWPRITPDHR